MKYLILLLAVNHLGFCQYVDLWQYSACSLAFGGTCSRSCGFGEQRLDSLFCFYGFAQCCVPSQNGCENAGGYCRSSCGFDRTVRHTNIRCSGQQSCCIPAVPLPTTSPPNTLTVSQRQGVCGSESVNRQRILNGYTGKPCEWPWMASLRHTSKGLFCSGVLINNDTVLTAAHCVLNAPVQEIRVHLGDFNTDRFDYPEVSYPVRKIDILEGYRFEVKGKNLALIKLSTPLKYDSCKAPACLPDSSIPVKTGSHCYIAGFGDTQYGRSTTLQAADVTLLQRQECQYLSQFATRETLPSDVLCSNSDKDNTDACKGDDGGMLVCPDVQNRWSLVGIVSHYSCNRLPTLYTDVAYHIQWILNNL